MNVTRKSKKKHALTAREQQHTQKLKLLIIIIVCLNALDAVLTVLGIQEFNLDEGNPLVKAMLHDISLLIVMKLVFVTSVFVFFLAHIARQHYHFAKPWEDTTALFVGTAVIIMYLFVIANNLILIF